MEYETDNWGNKFTKLNGKLHSFNDEPARVYPHGDIYWYRDGERHRDNDMPAVVLSNESKFWYQNGKLHRDNDLSAVIYPDWYSGMVPK